MLCLPVPRQRFRNPVRLPLKAVKFISIGLLLACIAGVAAYLMRDRLIQRLSGPLLLEYGIQMTDVSLDAISLSDATIRYVELVHEGGTIFKIRGLHLPYRSEPGTTRFYSAESVAIVLAESGDSEPSAPAEILGTLLSLPENLAHTGLRVSRLEAAPYPVIENLEWSAGLAEQSLSVNLAGTDVHAAVHGRNQASITINDRLLKIAISEQPDGYRLGGAVTVELASTYAFLEPILAFPSGFQVSSGSADLQYEAIVPADASVAAGTTLTFTPTAPIVVRYSAADDVTSLSLAAGGNLEIEIDLRTAAWQLRQDQVELLVSAGDQAALPVTLNGLSCSSDLRCSWGLAIDVPSFDLAGMAKVDSLSFEASQQFFYEDGRVNIDVAPTATLTLSGVHDENLQAQRVAAILTSEANIVISQDGWQLSADSVAAEVLAVSFADSVSADIPLRLSELHAGATDTGASASLKIDSLTASVRMDQGGMVLPEMTGALGLRNNKVTLGLSPTGEADNDMIRLAHDLDTETGRLQVDGAALDFGGQNLSDRIEPWPYDFDLTDGRIAADLRAVWEPARDEYRVTAESTAAVAGLAGLYEETAFAGLSTRVMTQFDSESGLYAEPFSISVSLIEIGLPISNLGADLTPDLRRQRVQVDNLRMNAFGGNIVADSFSFDSAADSNNLLLRADSIELEELLTVQDFADIELSGSISAELPVSIAGASVTIVGGKLTGEPPGGVIRYLPGLEADGDTVSGIALATRALSNFEYESLESQVDYTATGNLKLKMRLQGRNPDLDEGRPVVLNLGLENNVPSMLKSLQAARAVEEILERKILK